MALLIYCNIRFALVFNYEIMNDNTREILLSVAIISMRMAKNILQLAHREKKESKLST